MMIATHGIGGDGERKSGSEMELTTPVPTTEYTS